MDLLDSDLHADVKGGAQCCERVWTFKLLQNLPWTALVLGKVYKHQMELLILLTTFLLQLADSKNHDSGAPISKKSAL